MADGALKILFVGQSWLGSCARSLREALARRDDVEIEEVNEDGWFTSPRKRWLRAVNRITNRGYTDDFAQQILRKVREYKPHVLMTYKGAYVDLDLIAKIRQSGTFCVNIYPDYSPHAYGMGHQRAVGGYDLVISTKIYHPPLWNEVYGYENACAFVPQGYDPALHLVEEPASDSEFDLVMVATYRREYGKLVLDLAQRLDDKVKVAIGGNGWEGARAQLPGHWTFTGGVSGRSYVSLLRKGRICIAPLNREVVINGKVQPGDVDTTRSYELAAAHCFFLHQRTGFAEQLYGPGEVPMFDDAADLAGLVRHYLANPGERERMAAAAHRRAVPAYSLDVRAAEIVGLLRGRVPNFAGDRPA